MKTISLILISLLTACSSQSVYESIKQNQCLERTGNMYCEEAESYDEYQRKRDELLKEDQKK
jgi:hypothetical protein